MYGRISRLQVRGQCVKKAMYLQASAKNGGSFGLFLCFPFVHSDYGILNKIDTLRRHMHHNKIHTWAVSLHWRYNRRYGVSNHQPRDWLLNRLFRRRSKKTSASLALVGEFTSDRWIPHTKIQWRGKSFYLMASSWLMLPWNPTGFRIC